MVLVVSLLAACSSSDPPPGRTDPVGTPPDGDTASTVDTEPEPTDPRTDCASTAEVVVNEVQPSNHAVLVDEDGQSVDWIELYNAGTDAVDLAGFALTDEDEPGDWAFPATVLPPGQYLLVYASGKDRPQHVRSWDTRIDAGHAWRWLGATQAPPPDWNRPGFDDRAWATGPSGFGRGDEDDATQVDAHTAYVRTELEIAPGELGSLAGLVLHVDYDDGFVAYLNGVEVARGGMGLPGAPVAWDALADAEHEALMYRGTAPERFDLRDHLALLHEGVNVLALEVHDARPDSSDLTLLPFLSLGFGGDATGAPSPMLELPASRPHVDFAMSASGEAVRLFDAEGCLVDELEPDHPAWGDFSFGRKPDGARAVGWFADPTPEAPNDTESRAGFAETPTFDPPPGFYPDGVTIRVNAEDGALVRYAWDGWEPDEDAALVTGPLAVNAEHEARVVRARAWKDGLWPSRIATSTWLIREPGSLPVVSVVANPPDLFDEETGIYVLGPDASPEYPHDGANYWEDWERPVHLAMWEPDGTLGFGVDAGVKVHGGRSRTHDQRNLLVGTSSFYGDDVIEHEVFPGLGLDHFEELLLRSAGNDWLGCFSLGCSEGAHFRDALVHELARGPVDVMAYRPAESYVNGEYWGLYNLRERPGPAYVRNHFGVEDMDLLEMDAEVVEGDAAHYQRTMEWLRTHDLSVPANYAHVRTLIDVDEYLAWVVTEIYFDNGDWPGNNVKFWRPRTPDGRWRWLLYDVDFGLGNQSANPWRDTLAQALAPDHDGWPNPPWSTELFRLLMASPHFRDEFVNVYADHLNTRFLPEATRAKLLEFAARIADDVPGQVERWGRWTDGERIHLMAPRTWEQEVAWIDRWLGERPQHARDHLVRDLGLAGTWTLSLRADPPEGGTFALAAVEVAAPFDGTYFAGVPVTVTARPAPGAVFEGWSDPTLPATATVTLPPGGLDRPLTAIYR